MGDLKRGFVFAAIGNKYVDEAINAATSIKRHMPDANICLFTNETISVEVFSEVRILEAPEPDFKGIKLYKPFALMHSPYDVSVFLDSDTYMCYPCPELFEMTAHADLVLAHDTADMSLPVVDGKPLANFYPYNSGVMAFKRSQSTKVFLECWYGKLDKEFEEHPWDQRAMMASILVNDIKVYVLQPVYNCRTNFVVSLPQLPVKIIHGRDINFEKVEKRLNKVLKNRVWMPKRQKIILKRQRNVVFGFFRKVYLKLLSFLSKDN